MARKTAKDPALQARIAEAFGEKPEAPIATRTITPSGSKTDLFLTCAWPWGRKVVAGGNEDPGEPARFGSAYHEVLAAGLGARRNGGFRTSAKRYNVDPNRLRERVNESLPVLWKWLTEGNPWGVDFTRDMRLEWSYALNLRRHEDEQLVRSINGPTLEGHVYEDAAPNELPMTLDLTANARDSRGRHVALYLDHKSGFERLDVSEAGQLKSGALIFLEDQPDVIVIAFFHAPAHMAPEVFALEVTREELQEHYLALQRAHAARLSEPRSLTPSPLCPRCPTYAICPTNVSALVELRGGAGRLALTTPEAVGRAHQTLKEHEARFAAMVRIVDQEIRDAVRGPVGFGIRPDGKEVAFRDQPFTNLSLASIERAVGPIEAKKIVAYLDKLGVIERGVRSELRAK